MGKPFDRPGKQAVQGGHINAMKKANHRALPDDSASGYGEFVSEMAF